MKNLIIKKQTKVDQIKEDLDLITLSLQNAINLHENGKPNDHIIRAIHQRIKSINNSLK